MARYKSFKGRPYLNIGTVPTQTGGYRGFAYTAPDGTVYLNGVHEVNGRLYDLDKMNNNISNIRISPLSNKQNRWNSYRGIMYQDFPRNTDVYIPIGMVDDAEHTYNLSGGKMTDNFTGHRYDGTITTGNTVRWYMPEKLENKDDRAILEAYNKIIFDALNGKYQQ